MMIAEGLRATGHIKEAVAVLCDTIELIETAGLKEYYNPTTMEATAQARGLGAGNFGFTSAVYPRLLEMARDLGLRPEVPNQQAYSALYAFVSKSM